MTNESMWTMKSVAVNCTCSPFIEQRLDNEVRERERKKTEYIRYSYITVLINLMFHYRQYPSDYRSKLTDARMFASSVQTSLDALVHDFARILSHRLFIDVTLHRYLFNLFNRKRSLFTMKKFVSHVLVWDIELLLFHSDASKIVVVVLL
jgi:hypothetical protein